MRAPTATAADMIPQGRGIIDLDESSTEISNAPLRSGET
jgi:hypothetical protein